MTLPCSKSIWLLPTPFTSIWILLLMFPFKQRNVMVSERNSIPHLLWHFHNHFQFHIEYDGFYSEKWVNFVEFKHFSESTWRIQILPLLLLHWVSCWFSLSLFTQFQPTILLLILQTPMDSWISAISDVWSNSSSTPSMVSKIPTLPTIGDKKRWVQNFVIKGMIIKWV